MIARAALWPGAPVTPPPGGALGPQGGPEQLIQRHGAVKNVSASEPEYLLQVEGTQDWRPMTLALNPAA
jgi:hypothetical protein